MLGFMAIKDTPKIIESILGKEDLVRILEEFAILVPIKLKLLGPSKRMTMGSMT